VSSAAPDPVVDARTHRRIIQTVAFTLFLDLAGFGIILPVLPYYAESFGASATTVALLSTAFSLAQFLMSPVLGRISDRRGRRPVMLVSIAGSVFASLTLGFADALWIVFLARLVAGSSKANVSTAHAYVADITAPRDRARYMGLMGAALGMGFIFGPAIGGLLSTESMPTLPFFVSAGLSAVNFLMAWRWLPETRFLRRDLGKERDLPNTKSAAPARGLADVIPRLQRPVLGGLIVVTFVFFLAFASMESTFALYNEHLLGWGARETGVYLTMVGTVMVITQGMLVGRIVDRLGEARTLLTGIVLSGAGLAALGAMYWVGEWSGVGLGHGDDVTWLTLAMLLLSAIGIAGGNGLVSATMGALVSQVSASDEQGINMGLRESSASLARITGPVMAGPLFDHVNIGAPFLAGGLINALNVLLVLRLIRHLRARPDA
jgi:MFS family permease